MPASLGYIKAGKLRPLAVTAKTRPGGLARCAGDQRISAGLRGERLVRHGRAQRHAERHRGQAQYRDQRGAGRSRDKSPVSPIWGSIWRRARPRISENSSPRKPRNGPKSLSSRAFSRNENQRACLARPATTAAKNATAGLRTSRLCRKQPRPGGPIRHNHARNHGPPHGVPPLIHAARLPGFDGQPVRGLRARHADRRRAAVPPARRRLAHACAGRRRRRDLRRHRPCISTAMPAPPRSSPMWCPASASSAPASS